MRIKLWIEDIDTGDVLEELGECLTDNPNRAVQMYNQDEAWIEKGYNANVHWKDITNKAARTLGKFGGSRTSERKAASNRANGRKPTRPDSRPRGRPKKAR